VNRFIVGTILILLSTGMLTLAFNSQPVRAIGTIYIRADGTIDPPTAPIQRNGNLYTLTDNIYPDLDGIWIERNNMTLNGACYTLHGNGNNTGTGILASHVNNITLKNMKITAFEVGVALRRSNNDTIIGNNITANNDYGIYIGDSSNNSRINANSITHNFYGFIVDPYSSNNVISGNNITDNFHGLYFWQTHNNSIFHNIIMNGIQVIINNVTAGSNNIWDNGYPSGGNYWSDYTGNDTYKGVFQNITGSDGIGDQPYTIDANNIDHYPLMSPFAFGSLTIAGVNVTVFPTNDVCLELRHVIEAGFSTAERNASGPAPPVGRNLVGQYYEIKTTARYAGKTLIKIIYDDANMTLEQENSLQLLQWILQGDISGMGIGQPDGKVDGKDVALVAKAYDSKFGQPKYIAVADINGDLKVDGKDIAYVAKNYGKTQPVWINITIYVDTANNVIYGETSHFSIFGITL